MAMAPRQALRQRACSRKPGTGPAPFINEGVGARNKEIHFPALLRLQELPDRPGQKHEREQRQQQERSKEPEQKNSEERDHGQNRLRRHENHCQQI